MNRISTLCITWAEANKTHGRVYLILWLTAVLFFVQTMEPVDKLLQCVDPCKDRELWVRENKTGEIRPVDVEIWPQRCLTALHMHTFTPPSSHWSRGCSLRPDWNLLGSSLPPLIHLWLLTDLGTISQRSLALHIPTLACWGRGQCLGSLVSEDEAMNEDVR